MSTPLAQKGSFCAAISRQKAWGNEARPAALSGLSLLDAVLVCFVSVFTLQAAITPKACAWVCGCGCMSVCVCVCL